MDKMKMKLNYKKSLVTTFLLTLQFTTIAQASIFKPISEFIEKIIKSDFDEFHPPPIHLRPGPPGQGVFSPLEIPEYSIFKEYPCFQAVAKKIKKDAHPEDRDKIDRMLQQILNDELSKTSKMPFDNRRDPVKFFAKDIDKRAIDVIKTHNDILIKIIASDDQIIRLVNSKGEPLPTQSEYREVVSRLIEIFSPAIGEAVKDKNSKSLLSNIAESIKSNGGVDIDYDGKGKMLTASIKYGNAKVKLANIDIEKFSARAKYFIYGGGLTLGITKTADSKKSNEKNLASTQEVNRDSLMSQMDKLVPTEEAKRYAIMSKLDNLDREIIYSEAEQKYIFELYERAIKISKNNKTPIPNR